MASSASPDTSPESAALRHRQTRDPVNQPLVALDQEVGRARLGLMTNQVWHDDPKRLVFTLARYKFVAKMLSGLGSAVEIGCGDGFCARIVAQAVGRLTVLDYDPLFIDELKAAMVAPWRFDALVHDILSGPPPGRHDGAYSLDVLEHVPADQEDRFLRHLCAGLTDHGVAIIGMPSLESQTHASPPSRRGHVNCKSGPDLRAVVGRYFHNVFVFSMNDEVVHTGFQPMAHYLLALACGPRRGAAAPAP